LRDDHGCRDRKPNGRHSDPLGCEPHRPRRNPPRHARAETIWRGLEYPPQFATPYQRFDFQAAWLRHVGEQESLRSFIVVAYDATISR